jgi:hypothetical protein
MIKMRLLVATLMVGMSLGACTEEGAPPLFNAIDPSLQCPAGQVGWDFTTGGNDADVVPARVGAEIKIQSVLYRCQDSFPNVTKDLTALYRAECDNASLCERPILRDPELAENSLGACAKRTLIATYKCGNEPTLYDISRRYLPESSYQRQLVKLPKNLPTDKIVFACGDVITQKGYTIQIGEGQSPIQSGGLSSCNGKRRCFSDDLVSMYRYGDAPSRLTKYYYSCGSSPAVREAVIDNRAGNTNYIDFHCADPGTASSAERAPVIYLKETSYVNSPGGYGDLPPAIVKDVSDRLKAACEGRRSCRIPVTRTAGYPQYTFGSFKMEYWCGNSRGFTETKYVNTNHIFGTGQYAGTGEIALQCGGVFNIVRAQIGNGAADWVSKACPPGARTCSIAPGTQPTGVSYFCDNGDGASNNINLEDTQTSDFQFRPRTLECPLDDTGATGIKITGLNYNGSAVGELPSIAALSECNGKQSCLIRTAGNAGSPYQYRFRCPNTAETTSVRQGQFEYLDCKPNVNALAVNLLCTEPGNNNPAAYVRYSRSNAPICSGTSPTCSVPYGTYWSTTYLQNNCDNGVSVTYQCNGVSQFAKFFPKGLKTADGGHIGPDGGSILVGEISCPYDPTVKPTTSSKKCIPATCPNNKKRNQEMDCVDDAQIAVYSTLKATPYFEDPSWNPVTTIKEGFPHISYMKVEHSAPNLTANQSGTLWAYDVFKKKDNTGPEVKAFRCTIGSVAQNWDNGQVAVYGGWQTSESGLLPSDCFKDPPYGDLTSSWYHGSRRSGAALGVMNEQQFRNNYKIIRTMVVAAFDPKGRAIRSTLNAPNPVGFFYTPATGYIDQFDYLAQTSQFENERQITFAPSRQIELKATSGNLGVSQLVFDKETFKNPPVLDVDFGWNMLGDGPYHPFSDKRVASSSNVAQLRFRNLRATVEIAKETSALPNKWVESNAAVVGSFPIGDGNAQEKKERFPVRLPPDVVSRIMSVKGAVSPRRSDGWMNNNIEVNSVFKLRVCIDFDGISRAPGETSIDNRYTEASVGGVSYTLGVSRRCSDEYPFTAIRDLFPKPVLPINAAENPVENGNTTAQGGERVSSSDDVANQSGCRRQCTVNADCGAGGSCDKPANAIGVCRENTEAVQCKSAFRKGMVIGGKNFALSVVSVKNTGDTNAPRPRCATCVQTTSSSSNISLMNFNLVDSEEKKEGQLVPLGTKRETKISLGRVWSSVMQIKDIVDKINKVPKPVKVWYKPSFSKPWGGRDPLPGISFGISRDGYVMAGPVSIYLEVSFGASLSFDLAMKFINDQQTIATKTNQAQYPCLGTVQCLKKSTTAKNYVDANEDCNLQGGRLVEPRTAAALTALKAVAGSEDVWVGAQASHIFEDPTCTDLSTVTEAQKVARLAACKSSSVTRYHWINGNVAFIDTQASGTAYNQSLYASAHGFGTITSVPNNGSPLRSALLMKSTGALENHAITDKLSDSSSVKTGTAVKEAKYVCEFDPAGAYKATEFSIGPSLEFSIGLSASACVPSGVIGACLSAEFKFITVGISIEYGNKSMKIFDTQTTTQEPRATIGGKGAIAKWEWAALTGRLFAEIRFFIGSKEFNILSYSGVAAGGGDLWDNVERFRRNRP